MAERELSAQQLAKRAGLTAPVIYAWLREEGKRQPRSENVAKVAKALDRSYDELWGAALDTSEQTRLVELETFVQEVRRLLDNVEPQPIARTPDRRLHPPATAEIEETRPIARAAAKRNRRDGTNR